jgi:hypothetical protein
MNDLLGTMMQKGKATMPSTEFSTARLVYSVYIGTDKVSALDLDQVPLRGLQ